MMDGKEALAITGHYQELVEGISAPSPIVTGATTTRSGAKHPDKVIFRIEKLDVPHSERDRKKLYHSLQRSGTGVQVKPKRILFTTKLIIATRYARRTIGRQSQCDMRDC
jgi:hypothetical protein